MRIPKNKSKNNKSVCNQNSKKKSIYHKKRRHGNPTTLTYKLSGIQIRKTYIFLNFYLSTSSSSNCKINYIFTTNRFSTICHEIELISYTRLIAYSTICFRKGRNRCCMLGLAIGYCTLLQITLNGVGMSIQCKTGYLVSLFP